MVMSIGMGIGMGRRSGGSGTTLAPVNTVLPVISGTTTWGQTLTTNNGSWANTPTSFAYQWKRAGSNIGGATASTYVLATADIGSTITCTVTATNAGGSTPATSAATSAVIDTAPGAMSAPTVTQATQTSISVQQASAPSNSGSPIASYDLRYSTDAATWTTVTGITGPQTVSSLLFVQVYYVQTRAVNTIAGAWSPSGMIATDAGVTAVNAEGWSVAFTSPPTFDPVNSPKTVLVSRQGYDGTATVATILDEFLITQRVRQAYPSQASLDASRCALNSYIYSTDTVSGVTNNSAEVSPKPVANWVLSDHQVVGNTIRLELVAFHRNGRNREQVAAVVFSATDGTTTVTQTVNATVISGRSGDANPIIVYQCDLNVSTLANPSTVTVNAKVYPWIGASGSVLDSSAQSAEREFSPRVYLRNTTLAAAPVFVCLNSSTGNDATGAVSTTLATAQATPCLTALGAINRAIAVNGSLDGVKILIDNPGTYVLASTATTRTQTVGECIFGRTSNCTRANAIFSFGAATFRARFGSAGGWLRFFDVSVLRTGTGSLQGEATSALHLSFDQINYDGGSASATPYSSSHGYWMGCVLTNIASGAVTAGTYENRLWRGFTMTLASNPVEAWLIVGCSITGMAGILPVSGGRGMNGLIMAYNKLMKVGNNNAALIVAGTNDVIGMAFVQNVLEFIDATTNPLVRVSYDSAAGNTQHIIIEHNSYAGFFLNGRDNIFYDEGPTRRTNKLMSVRGNIHVQINTKGDVFRGVNEAGADASSAVGNWPYLYGVDCESEFTQFIDAGSGGIGTSFAQAYPGLKANFGTSATVRNDPLYTTNAATTSGPTAGAGNGVYTLQGGSPCKGMVPRPSLRFDLAGATRSATAASAGAYE